MARLPNVRTLQVMALELSTSVSRVRAILKRHPEIRPAARAGRALVYDRAALAALRMILKSGALGCSAPEMTNTSAPAARPASPSTPPAAEGEARR
ncbi:MAG: hypothetical protein ABSE73_23570 [Planctomycetota bacterium]